MKKKLLDLLAKKKAVLDKMKAADTANDQTAFDAAQAELAPIDAEIARVKAIMHAEEGLPEGNAGMDPTGAPRTPVNSNECLHAFCECIRAQARGDSARFLENAEIVTRAVRNEGALTEGTPADGGLIVPQDIQTAINERKRALNPLSALFHVETVSTNTGSRVYDTQPTKGFTKVAEMGTISRDDKPSFEQVKYTVEDYALIVPVSNDLLNDTDQNLIAYLSRWLAKKDVITENNLLLALLKALDAGATAVAPTGALKSIKTIVNTLLDPMIASGASFLTNQTGFNFLDTLEDAQGRPLLQPNPVQPSQYMIGGRAVHVVSDAVLPNADTPTTPLYVGDFASFGTLFRRQTMQLDSTTVGGNAWNTNSTEVRAITRLDAVTTDEDAVAAAKISLTDPASEEDESP